MAGQVVGSLAGLGTNIAYSRLLNIEAVGVIAVVNGLSMWLMVAMDRGLVTWSTQALAKGTVSRRQVITTAIHSAVAPLSLSVVVVIFVQLSQGPESLVASASLLAIPLGVSLWIYQVGLSVAQGLGQAHRRAAAIALNGLGTLVLTAGALSFKASIWMAIGSSAIAYASIGMWLMMHSRSDGVPAPPHLDRRCARRQARPLFLGNIATYAIAAGDVVIAAMVMPTSDVGRYQIAKKVAQFAAMPLLSTVPMLTGRLSSMNYRQRDASIASLLWLGLIMFSVGFLAGCALLPHSMAHVFGAEYESAWPAALMLLAGAFIQFIKEISAANSIADGRFLRPALVSLVPPLTFVVLMVTAGLGGWRVSASGLALVSVLSFASGAILMLAPHRHSHSLALRTRLQGLAICLFFMMVVAAFYFYRPS